MDKVKSLSIVSIVLVALFAACMMVGAVSAYAVPVKSVNSYTGYAEDDFIDVDGKPGYCAEERQVTYPNTNPVEYDQVFTTAADYESNTNVKDKDYWKDATNQWDNIRRVLYFGYPHDGAGVQGSASDDDFRKATQLAVWEYTNPGSRSGENALRDAIIAAVNDSSKTVPDTAVLKFVKNSSLSPVYQSMFVMEVSDTPTPTEKVKTTVEKKWTDADGNAIDWPEGQTITVEVTYGTNDPEQIELSASKTSAETKEYDEDEDAEFKVEEVAVEGYTSEIAGDATAGFVITNTEDSSTDEPTIVNTTVTANGETADAENAAAVIASAGDTLTISDVVELKNLDATKTYTLTCNLMNVDAPNEPVATAEATVTDGKTKVTVKFDNITVAGSAMYTVVTELTGEGATEPVATHNGNLDILSETITVTENEPTPAAGIGTTVSVNGVKADNSTVLNLENDEIADALPVKDTVEYQGLTPGASYTLTGELMKVVAKEATTAGVEPVSITVKASDEGTGTWEMDFGEVQLEEDTYYVVFETLEGGDLPAPIEHKNIEDKAQAINVGTGWENTEIYEEQPPFTPVFEPTYDPKILRTTVSINGSKASSTRARTVSYADASKVKNVRDEVEYEGFNPNETYTLVALLVDPTTGKAVANGNISDIKTPDATGAGTWTMDFTGVTIEPGHKYVVYEYAYDENNKLVAKHEDPNDPAQTIVVTTRPSVPTSPNVSSAARGTTAKTGDASGPAVIALGIIALAAVGAAYGARRRTNK